jgi:8-oxo-dGTP pyrophosphatase MutT (NUDIX family)
MQCYHLAYMAGANGADVVLSTKNIFGNRSKHRVQARKIIWHNCGQFVISGGGASAADPNLTMAAQREYFEETGVDFRDANVRAAMMCIGDPVLHVFANDPDGYCCVYQMVSNQSPLVATANANIVANTPADDELHDCGTAPGAHAVTLFGPPLLAGWRLSQYQALSAAEMAIADQRMVDPFDWFINCVNHLVGGALSGSMPADGISS